MRHRAAHDPAQGVAAPLVRRGDAVRDEECRGAGVVGDDAHRHVGGVHRAAVPESREAADRVEQRDEQVGVVIGEDALQHGGDPLQPHARVDRGGREGGQRAVGLPVELHEHVVPDLDVAVALARDAQAHGLGAGQVVAAEVMHLGAPPARPGLAHRPEIVLAQLADPVRRQVPAPDLVGLLVARDALASLVHRRVEALGRQLPDIGQQRPGEGHRVGLEVVAEREIAQHLEERVVARRRSDVLQVVVLPAHAHALLRGRRPLVIPLLTAQEQVLELVHPGVGEQQRRVVGRDEGRAGDDLVALAREEVEERGADLVRGHNTPF